MHRFFLSPEQCRGELLTLTGGEAHHALKVLRVQTDEKVIVLNGSGAEFLCRVVSGRGNQVTLRILESRAIPPLPYRITLAQALPKGKLFDSIVQKATELGVAEIVPLLTERVVARLEDKDQTHKQEKWQSVAVEAIKQCGSACLPKITAPVTPRQLLKGALDYDLSFVGSLQPDAQHPRHFFRAFQSDQGRMPRSACVWIGPEGDFTAEELALIKSSGAYPITLGPLVLRTETAALYCLSILNYEFTWASES